jgi:hypothetical protein
MNNNNFDEDTTGSNASDSAARGETEVIDLADEDGDQRNQIVIFASSNKKEKSWVWEHFSKTEKKEKRCAFCAIGCYGTLFCLAQTYLRVLFKLTTLL